MSGTTYTWNGNTANNNWVVPANWLVGTTIATDFPNGPTVSAIDNIDNGGQDAIISAGATITLGTLTVGDPTTPVLGTQGGHVLVGGGPAIGGDGDGTLIAGAINVTSTNSGGGIVGGPQSEIIAPVMTLGTGAIIGGGGVFDITNLVNAGGVIQADGGNYNLGTLVINSGTISGAGSIEVDSDTAISGLELNAPTAETIRVNTATGLVATVLLDQPTTFTGTLDLNTPNSHVNLFLKNQAPTGAVYDNGNLIITGAGGATLDVIPFIGNGVSAFRIPTSTIPGYGEVSIAPPGGTAASSILLQNDNGTAAIWQAAGTSITGSAVISPSPGPTWTLATSGPFYAGDTNDFVWQSQDGSVALWQIANNAFVSGTVLANPSSAWQVKGTGDFFGNGDADVLLQKQDGSVAAWDINGGTIAAAGVVANPGTAWQVKGSGDFFQNGHSDVLLQNQDGTVAIWDVNGGTIAASTVLAQNPGATELVKGTGDFFGNGDTDILFQGPNGSVVLWDIGNTGTVAFAGTVANPGPTWHIQGASDLNNDGKTDITFQNEDGSVAVWDMNGTTISASAVLANPGTPWHALSGSANMKFIPSGPANSTIASSAAIPNEFIFTNFATGAHTISGFATSQDIVELSSTHFADFAAVQAATTSTPNGAVINLGSSSTLLLSGVSTSALHASNFAIA